MNEIALNIANDLRKLADSIESLTKKEQKPHVATVEELREPATPQKYNLPTLEERIAIVKYCIGNNKNYQLTAEIFDVSYQQVYGWVRKFEEYGEDALVDKRGRNKVESELTVEEKIKLAMKRIEKENERLKAENAFLKKLQELEGRRY
jgi:transposase